MQLGASPLLFVPAQRTVSAPLPPHRYLIWWGELIRSRWRRRGRRISQRLFFEPAAFMSTGAATPPQERPWLFLADKISDCPIVAVLMTWLCKCLFRDLTISLTYWLVSRSAGKRDRWALLWLANVQMANDHSTGSLTYRLTKPLPIKYCPQIKPHPNNIPHLPSLLAFERFVLAKKQINPF